MKRIVVVCILLVSGLVTSLSAQTVTLSKDFSQGGPVTPSYGNWQAMNGRLYQNDASSPLAKVNFPAPQSGLMQYEFNVRYEGGGDDRMGGFGIQIFVDNAFDGRSWGDGHSYLLWLNYDENPTYGQAGFRAQVYKSNSPSDMTLVPGYDVGLDASYLSTDNLSTIVPVKIVVDGNSGDVKVYDPTQDNWVYVFNLGAAPGTGNFIALRTNSLAVSFDGIKVTKLQ